MKARRVIAIILWVFAGFMFIGAITDKKTFQPLFIEFIVFTAIGFIVYFAGSKKARAKFKEEKTKIKNDRLSNTLVRHFTGLPLAEGTNCTIQHNPDGFVFTAGGNTFNLLNDKITDMCIKTNVEIQRQYVSSIGGAVGGAVLFGPIGAMIGGRAKEKRTTNLTHYLILTYLKDGQVAYICFEIYEVAKIQKWINDFRQCPHAQGVNVNL